MLYETSTSKQNCFGKVIHWELCKRKLYAEICLNNPISDRFFVINKKSIYHSQDFAVPVDSRMKIK